MIKFNFNALNQNYSEQFQESYVENTPDAGIPFRREIYSDVGKIAQNTFLFTDVQYNIFNNFYLNDTRSGSQTFLVYDCINDIDRPAKMIGTPSVTRLSNKWRVIFKIYLEPVRVIEDLLLSTKDGAILTTKDGKGLLAKVGFNV